MQTYRNKSGESGVIAYEIGDDYIDVKFKSGVYRYSYHSAGKTNVEKMKKLAKSGEGLNAFINVNVKYDYVKWSKKIREKEVYEIVYERIEHLFQSTREFREEEFRKLNGDKGIVLHFHNKDND